MEGNINLNMTFNPHSVHPTLFLKTDTVFTIGTGNESDPYILV